MMKTQTTKLTIATHSVNRIVKKKITIKVFDFICILKTLYCKKTSTNHT